MTKHIKIYSFPEGILVTIVEVIVTRKSSAVDRIKYSSLAIFCLTTWSSQLSNHIRVSSKTVLYKSITK